MDLQQLAIEMRATALENKLSLESIGPALAKQLAGAPNKTTRHELIDGEKMMLSLTYDELTPSLGLWHLSFSIEGHKPLLPELIDKVKEAFLDNEPPTLEIPSLMWGPAVRQYIQKANI
jgi:hypothetical protein